MDVPEPGATADPWGTGAGAAGGATAGAAAGATAASEDPWHPYGIHECRIYTVFTGQIG